MEVQNRFFDLKFNINLMLNLVMQEQFRSKWGSYLGNLIFPSCINR
jgi:hypothetical protein